jgi:hypothetical protein
VIGTRRVMNAKADGYTLLMQVPAIVLSKYTPDSSDRPVANYRRASAMVTALVANINAALMGPTASLAQHKAGALRIIDAGSARRTAAPAHRIQECARRSLVIAVNKKAKAPASEVSGDLEPMLTRLKLTAIRDQSTRCWTRPGVPS